MPAARMDISRLLRRMKAIKNVRGELEAATLRAVGPLLIQRIAITAPRDTNRFVRGWILAGRDAGITNLPTPIVIDSHRKDQYVQRLAEQWSRARALADRLHAKYDQWYGRSGRRPGAYGGRLQRDILKAEERASRAYEELQLAETVKGFIFIGQGKAVAQGSMRGFNQRHGLGRIATVRVRIYGGRGAIRVQQNSAYLVLHNLEPHATLVENRHRVYRNAVSAIPQLARVGGGSVFRSQVRKAWAQSERK
jgi:hypothetical protein